MIGSDVLRRNQVKFQNNYNVQTLLNASGELMSCPDEIEVIIRSAVDTEVVVNALVCDDVKGDILLAWHDLMDLQVLPKGFPNARVVQEVSAYAKSAMGPAKTAFEAGRQRLLAEFKDVFSNTLSKTPMKGDPMRINLRPGSEPKRVAAARKVPLQHREEAQKALDEFLELGIIERVDPNTPTEWVAPGFWVLKSDGKRVRLVTDFTALNKCIDSPTHPFPSSRDIVAEVPADATVFFKMDCVHGYFQKALAEEDKLLTTFLLEQGKFCYRRSPMGLSPSSPSWCFSSDPLVEGLPYAKKIVDDVIGWGNASNWEERARVILSRARDLGITISIKKFEVDSEIVFAGYTVGSKGVKPDPSMTRAIADFPAPKDKTELRSFLGLANQLGFFVPDLAQQTAAMRVLLKKDSAWFWTDQHASEFVATKNILTSGLVVKPFDPKMETVLLTDASRLKGLGFALMQRPRGDQGTGQHHLVQCGSCSLTPTQRNYAIVELECLAIQWAVKKCHFWLAGRHFKVYTDHKPLEGVFRKDAQDVVNTRLQRLREKLMPYKFQVQWVPGKHHYIADALSRAPLFVKEAEELEVDAAVACTIRSNSVTMKSIIQAASEDSVYLEIKEALKRGKQQADVRTKGLFREFKPVWNQLSIIKVDGGEVLVLDAKRLVVPQGAQRAVLALLHASHAGKAKTRELANRLYFWQSMAKDIDKMVDACEACQTRRPSQAREPAMAPRSPATYPMSHVGTDLFKLHGRDFLVMVDRFSGFPFLAELRRTHTSDVVQVLTAWFRQFGWPRAIRTDGGPQFRGEFSAFCKTYDMVHELSSPYNPESNGLAEAAVKSMKKLVSKCKDSREDIDRAIQFFRNTPRADGFSPAEMLFGRMQRCELPSLPQHQEERVDLEAAVAAREATQQRQREYQQQHAIALRPLQLGEWVRIQDPITHQWTAKGIVLAVRDSGHSYDLETECGTLTTRNRRFLKPLSATQTSSEEEVCAEQALGPGLHAVSADAGPEETPAGPRRSSRIAEKARAATVSCPSTTASTPPSPLPPPPPELLHPPLPPPPPLPSKPQPVAAAPAVTIAPISTSFEASGWFSPDWQTTWAPSTPRSRPTQPLERPAPTTSPRLVGSTSSRSTPPAWEAPRASSPCWSFSSWPRSPATAASSGAGRDKPPSQPSAGPPSRMTPARPFSYAAAASRPRTTVCASPPCLGPQPAAETPVEASAPTTSASGSPRRGTRPPGLYPQGSEAEGRHRHGSPRRRRGGQRR